MCLCLRPVSFTSASVPSSVLQLGPQPPSSFSGSSSLNPFLWNIVPCWLCFLFFPHRWYREAVEVGWEGILSFIWDKFSELCWQLQLCSNPIANSSCQACEWAPWTFSPVKPSLYSSPKADCNCMRDSNWELPQLSPENIQKREMIINYCFKPLSFRVVSFAARDISNTHFFPPKVICKLWKLARNG